MKTLNSISKSLLWGFLSLTLAYCGKPVDVTSLYDISKDADKVPPIMIEGRLTNGIGPHYVRITKPVSISSKNPAYVSNAYVTISDDRGNSEMLAYKENGYYTTNTLMGFNDGRTYTLSVVADGKTYTATSVMPETSLPIDSLVSRKWDSDQAKYEVYIYAKVNVATPEYYAFQFYRNDTLLNPANAIYQANNSQLNGKIEGISFPKSFRKGDKATFQFFSVTKEADAFYVGLSNQLGSDGGTFGTPPANVKGNIPGALGLFQATYLREAVLVVK